ncbi:MAG: ATP-binding protein [Planctomycetota bacterium]
MMRNLSRILNQPEGLHFERKSLWHGPPEHRRPRKRSEVRDQIAEYVSAFANADGGTLVLGVEDNGTPTGHGYPPDVIDQLLRVPEQLLRPSQPPGRRISWQQHELILFEVQPAGQAVKVLGNGFPLRVHDTVVLESEETINADKRSD